MVLNEADGAIDTRAFKGSGGEEVVKTGAELNADGTEKIVEKGAGADEKLLNEEYMRGEVRGSGLTADKLLGLGKTIFNKPITGEDAYQKLHQNKIRVASDEPYEIQVAKQQANAANLRSSINQNQTTDATLNAITGLQANANKSNVEMQDLAQRRGELSAKRAQQMADESENSRMETEFNNNMRAQNAQADLQKKVANRQHVLNIADEVQSTMLQNRMEKDQKQALANQFDEQIAQNEYGDKTNDVRSSIADVTSKRDAAEKELGVDNAYIKHYEGKGLDKLTPEEKADYNKRKIELETKTSALSKYNKELSGADGKGGLNAQMKQLPKDYNDGVKARQQSRLNSGGDGVSRKLQKLFGTKVFKSGGKTVSLQDKKELIRYKEEIEDTKAENKELRKTNLEYAKLFAKIKGDKNNMYVKMLNSIKPKK